MEKAKRCATKLQIQLIGGIDIIQHFQSQAGCASAERWWAEE
jgi:hypothetical protein